MSPVLAGFQWTVHRTYQQFVDLHKVVSVYSLIQCTVHAIICHNVHILLPSQWLSASLYSSFVLLLCDCVQNSCKHLVYKIFRNYVGMKCEKCICYRCCICVCVGRGGDTHTLTHTTLIHTHTHTHTQLVNLYGVDRHLLPSKGVLGFFSRPKKAELTETQAVLEGMLMAVIKNRLVAPTELFNFLDYPFSVSLSLPTQSTPTLIVLVSN